MATQVLLTLTAKRHEIESHITKLEADLERARRDLSAILTATTVFSGEGRLPAAYMNLAKLFPRHELPRLCMAALKASDSPMSTREIAAHIMQVRGMDLKDRHLKKAVAFKLVNVLRRWERQKRVSRVGKNSGALVWRQA